MNKFEDDKAMISPEMADLGFEKAEYDFEDGIVALKLGMGKWEQRHSNERTLVLIAGASATGKGTLIERLDFPEDETSKLNLDDYYLGSDRMQKEFGFVNFSIPQAMDTKRINDDLNKILTLELGEIVKVPVYSMRESKAIGEKDFVIKKRLLIEGVYTLNQVDQQTPFKIYIQSDPEIRLARKMVRDTKERGATEELIRDRFEKNSLPATKEFVEPQKSRANLIITNNEKDLPEYL